MKTKIFILADVLLCLILLAACETVNLDNPDLCTSNADCSGGELCSEGVCNALCTDDAECDFYCDRVNGTCSKCLVNSHCPNGYACNIGRGVCMAFCGSDADCGEDKICSNGKCSLKQCTQASDCKVQNQKCLDGRCIAEALDSYPEQVPCEAGRKQCWENSVVFCAPETATWQFSHTCKENDTCISGVCRSTSSDSAAYVCQPYSMRCANDRRMLICRPDGSQYVEWAFCAEDQVCVSGNCVKSAE